MHKKKIPRIGSQNALFCFQEVRAKAEAPRLP